MSGMAVPNRFAAPIDGIVPVVLVGLIFAAVAFPVSRLLNPDGSRRAS